MKIAQALSKISILLSDLSEDVQSDTVIAVVLGILAVGCIVTQILIADGQVTKRETALFNLLQLFLTTGFSWYGARAINIGAFEASLKKFAIDAYRRITDIDAIIGRLQDRLEGNTSGGNLEGTSSDLCVALAMVEDTRQIINSSIADWTDVIGDELLAYQQVTVLEKELQSKKQVVAPTDNEKSQDFRLLEKRISELWDTLPARMKISDHDIHPSKPAILANTRLYTRLHYAENGLLLNMVAGGYYGEYDIAHQLEAGDKLTTARRGDRGINVYDLSEKLIGRLRNTISSVTYDEFEETLTKCHGSHQLKLSVNGIKRHKPDVKLIWINVKVLNSPVISVQNT